MEGEIKSPEISEPLIGINQGGTEALLLLPGSGPREDTPEGKEFWYLVAL